jgi:hypothetical protein
MQACDKELMRRIPTIQGHRYLDDYELAFRDRAEAEEAFHILENILSDYELALNPRKTRVVELPIPIEAVWAAPLRTFGFRSSTSGQLSDMARYFDLAFAFHITYPDDAVLQYAISRLHSLDVAEPNWKFFQMLLLNCVAPEPATFPYVLREIATRVQNGASPDHDALSAVAHSLIVEHSGLGHSSEVAWALWASLAFELMLSSDAVDRVSDCDDPVVAILALHCESEGRCATNLRKDLWYAHMTQADLYEEHWLLSYEANVKDWLPTRGGGDHVGSDPNFSFLKSSGVYFYDPSRGIPSAPGGAPPLPGIPRFAPISREASP